MNAKESLERKLVSEAELEDAMRPLGNTITYNCPARWYGPAGLNIRTGTYVTLPWWLRREHLRIDNGVYQTTDILTSLNESWATQYAVHVSKSDAAMVAFTPSPEYGEQDRQLTTTLGKFLRKYFLTLTDKHIQTLEQEHRAEMTATFELASSKEEIEYVYRNMEGDTACMRNPPSYYSLNDDTHPSHVYAAPGMGVAFTSRNGKVMSRAVVWVNPADPEDKRYVRLYGEPVLGKLLAKAGYKMQNLAGARVKRIPRVMRGETEPTSPNYYVMPYLDGIGGDQSKADGTYVVDYGDPEYLSLVTKNESIKIRSAVGERYSAQAKSTGAAITLHPLPPMQYVSDITGIEYSAYETPSVKYWLSHAKRVGVAAESETTGPGWSDAYMYTDEDSDRTTLYFRTGTLTTFDHGWNSYVDNLTTRKRIGFQKLSLKYYPESDNWFRGSVRQAGDEVISAGDSVWVLPKEEGPGYYIHKSEVAALRKQGFVNCSPTNEEVTIIHKARPTARRSTGGTWFDVRLHDQFKETFEGVWMHQKSAFEVCMFGQRLYSSKSNAHTNPAIVAELLKRSRYGMRMVETTDVYVAITDVSAIRSAVNTITSYALQAVKTRFNYLYRVHAASDQHGSWLGDMNYDLPVTWPACLAFADAARRTTDTALEYNHGRDNIRNMEREINVVREHLDPLLTRLNARIEQLELEAAGQMRIEYEAEELECA